MYYIAYTYIHLVYSYIQYGFITPFIYYSNMM